MAEPPKKRQKGPEGPPCDLEPHELRIGSVTVRLERRRPGRPSLLPPPPSAAAGAAAEVGSGDRAAAEAGPPLEGDTTGLDLWAAATRHCVRYLQGDQGRLLLAPAAHEGGAAAVLEVGAGLGAAGLFAAAMGAHSLCLTDGEECVLPLLRRNARLNGSVERTSIAVARLRFGNGDEARAAHGLLAGSESQPLLILACDVLYSQTVASTLLATLRELFRLHPHPATALISHTVRRSIFRAADGSVQQEETDTVLDAFLSQAREGAGGGEGCEVEMVARGEEDGEELLLYRVRPRR